MGLLFAQPEHGAISIHMLLDLNRVEGSTPLTDKAATVDLLKLDMKVAPAKMETINSDQWQVTLVIKSGSMTSGL